MRRQSPWTTCILLLALLALSACDAFSAATPTPERNISVPTLQPSPTVLIRSSDEIYGDNVLDGRNDPTAAAHANQGVLPPVVVATRAANSAETVQVVTEDGTLLLADLYQRFELAGQPLAVVDQAGQMRVPGLLIVAQDRLAWGLLPGRLSAAGFTVMVAEMRQPPRAADVRALLESLSELSTVDPARLAVVGSEVGADVAFLGCAVAALCDAAALISPQSGDILANVLPDYNPRPLWVTVGRDDQAGYNAMLQLSTGANGPLRVNDFETGRGTTLLRTYPEISERLTEWLSAQFAP
jgi:hypothetical protein